MDINLFSGRMQPLVRLIQYEYKFDKIHDIFFIDRNLRFERNITSINRIKKIKKSNGDYDIFKKQFEVVKYYNNKGFASKRILNPNFSKKHLNKLNIINISYIKTIKGWLCLINIIDPKDSRTIKWALFLIKCTDKTIILIKKKEISIQKRKKIMIHHQEIQSSLNQNRGLFKSDLLDVQSMKRKDKLANKSFFRVLKPEKSKLKKR